MPSNKQFNDGVNQAIAKKTGQTVEQIEAEIAQIEAEDAAQRAFDAGTTQAIAQKTGQTVAQVEEAIAQIEAEDAAQRSAAGGFEQGVADGFSAYVVGAAQTSPALPNMDNLVVEVNGLDDPNTFNIFRDHQYVGQVTHDPSTQSFSWGPLSISLKSTTMRVVEAIVIEAVSDWHPDA